MKKNPVYALILIIVLGLVWYMANRTMKEEEPFTKAYEFSFGTKSVRQIDEFAKRTLGEYRFSQNVNVQLRSLVNALECHHYLVFNNAISVSRFYDFMRIVLLPQQREQLRDKDEYVYEIKRYLRRKRNLNVQYLRYEVSEPIRRQTPSDSWVDVTVIRTDARNRELITYSFKTFNNRYYLFFQGSRSGRDFTFFDKSI
jgi:hypothetical protein